MVGGRRGDAVMGRVFLCLLRRLAQQGEPGGGGDEGGHRRTKVENAGVEGGVAVAVTRKEGTPVPRARAGGGGAGLLRCRFVESRARSTG